MNEIESSHFVCLDGRLSNYNVQETSGLGNLIYKNDLATIKLNGYSSSEATATEESRSYLRWRNSTSRTCKDSVRGSTIWQLRNGEISNNFRAVSEGKFARYETEHCAMWEEHHDIGIKFDREIARYTEENDVLRRTIFILKADLIEKEASMYELRKTNQYLNATNRSIENELRNTKRKLGKLQEKYDDLGHGQRAEYCKLQTAYDSLKIMKDIEVDNLQDEVRLVRDSALNEIFFLENYVETLKENFDEEIGELSDSLEKELTIQRKAIHEKDREHEDLELKITALEEEKAELGTEIEAYKQQLQEQARIIKREQGHEIEQYKSKVTSLEKDKAEFKIELAEVKRHLKKQNQIYQDEREKYEALVRDFNANQQDKETIEHTERLHDEQLELYALQVKLTGAQTMIDKERQAKKN